MTENNDDELTIKEFNEIVHTVFSEFDANKDGLIDINEFLAAVEEKDPKPENLIKFKAEIAKFDKNNDGKLDVKEFISFMGWDDSENDS